MRPTIRRFVWCFGLSHQVSFVGDSVYDYKRIEIHATLPAQSI